VSDSLPTMRFENLFRLAIGNAPAATRHGPLTTPAGLSKLDGAVGTSYMTDNDFTYSLSRALRRQRIIITWNVRSSRWA